MAEGFANRYGHDVMEVLSAGLAPAPIVQGLTKKVMEDKNINIDHQQPKELSSIDLSNINIIVNMSGRAFPMRADIDVREWAVEDPIGKDESVYVAVRDLIEMRVMRLVLELRRQLHPPQPRQRPKRALAAMEAQEKGAGEQ